jgi:hypothetical protein
MKYLHNAWDKVTYGPSIHAQLLLTELEREVVNVIHAEMQNICELHLFSQ